MESTPFYIKKIKLSNGAVYNIYDSGAPRKEDLDHYLPIDGKPIVGDLVVEGMLKANKLKVESIEYIYGGARTVLVRGPDGFIKQEPLDGFLKDIGGCSFSTSEEEPEIITFKVGK